MPSSRLLLDSLSVVYKHFSYHHPKGAGLPQFGITTNFMPTFYVKIKNNISTFPFSSNNIFEKFFFIKITNSRQTIHVKKSILPTSTFVMYYFILSKFKSVESPLLVNKISLAGSLASWVYILSKNVRKKAKFCHKNRKFKES